MKQKVLIPQPIAQVGVDYLKENGYEVVFCDADEQSIIDHIGDCAAVTSRTSPYTKGVMDAAPNLKIISNFGAGVDNIDVEYATEKGIWVTNTPGANAVSVAEHAVYLMLAAARNGYRTVTEVRKGNWMVKDELSGLEISEKTLGLVGVGNIGRKVAEMCHSAFHMKVLAYDPFVDKTKVPDFIQMCDSIDDICINADVVSIHVPFSPGTPPVFGARELSLLKPTAIFVNTSRGGNVDETALCECLKARKIFGAAIDVTVQEPINEDNELLTLSNIYITPHHASLTIEGRNHMTLALTKNIHLVLSGSAPASPVNRPTSK